MKAKALDEGITIEIIWDDVDLKMVVVDAANGRFRAHAEAYVAPGELGRIAEAIDGFPLGQKDSRTVAVGTARLRFFCREETMGHAMVEVKCAGGTDEYPELAQFFLAVETSAVQDFVRQLRAVGERKEIPATLRAGRVP
ncbi:MAG TPA: hypothetical protein VF997_01425 [Polyangia bacterium]